MLIVRALCVSWFDVRCACVLVGCTMDGPSQLDVTLEHLAANNASFNRLYIDVEDWGSDQHTAEGNKQTKKTRRNNTCMDPSLTIMRRCLCLCDDSVGPRLPTARTTFPGCCLCTSTHCRC